MTASYTPTTDSRATSRTPRVTPLVMGLVFLGIVVSWLLTDLGVVDPARDGWLVPGVLVLAGLVGLVAWAATQRRGGTDAVGTSGWQDGEHADERTDPR